MTVFRVTPTTLRVLGRFLAYAKLKRGIWFLRNDQIAGWAVEHRSITSVYERGTPVISGLPGSPS